MLLCPEIRKDSAEIYCLFQVAGLVTMQVMGVLNEKKAELKAVQANVL